MQGLYKKSVIAFAAILASFILIATPIMAVTYTAVISLANNSATSYGMLPMIWTVDNANLVSGGYISSTGLDVKVASGGTSVPIMLVSDKTLLAAVSNAHTTSLLDFSADNAPVSAQSIITGYNGYITTTDAAALEPANNFEIEISGYFDTSSAGKYIVKKDGALELYVSAANTITGRIYGTGTTDGDSYTAPLSGTKSIYGVNWYSNIIACTAGDIIVGVTLNVEKVGSPSGNFTVSLYALTAGVPSGSPLATVNTTATSVGTGAQTFTFASSYAATTTSYAIVASCANGDVSNYIKWNGYGADLDATLVPYSSANSGGAWSIIADWEFSTTIKLAVVKTVVGTGISSGVHTIKFGTVSTNLKLYDGVTEKASTAMAGTSAVNNANNFIWLNNNSCPYVSYIKYTVGGALVITYQPVAIISGTTLPDTTGTAQDGAITFGTNPADITATSTGGLVSTGAPTSIPTVVPTNRPDFLVPYAPPTDNPLNSGTPFDVVITKVVDIFNDQSGNATLVSIPLAWAVLWFIIIEAAMVLCLKFIPNQIIGAVVGGIGFVAAWKFGALPGWAFFIFAATAVGVVVMEWKRGKG